MYQEAKKIFTSGEFLEFLDKARDYRKKQIQMVLDGDTSRSKDIALDNLCLVSELGHLFIQGLRSSDLTLDDISKGGLDNCVVFGAEWSWIFMGILALSEEEEYSEEKAKEIWLKEVKKTGEQALSDEDGIIPTFIWVVTMGSSNMSFLARNWAINKIISKTNDDKTLSTVMKLLE